MDTVKVKINGKYYMVEKNLTILDACKSAHIEIPALCYMKGVSEEGSCGLCLVEIKGQRLLKRACITKVADGMEIYTNTERVRQARRVNLALILSTHKADCPICGKYSNCELRAISEKISLTELPFELVFDNSVPVLFDNEKMIFDSSKCIICQRCIKLCGEIFGVGVFSLLNRGIRTSVTILESQKCIGCGQCYVVCPTGAISENVPSVNITEYKQIAIDRSCFRKIFYNEAKEKKFIAALKRVGFEKVYSFDNLWNMCVDETVKQIKAKLSKNKKGVIITTICPAWQRYVEIFYPEFLSLSVGFHPVNLLGDGVLPVVSCLGVSNSITMNQLLAFIKEHGIDIESLSSSDYDRPYNDTKSFSPEPEYIGKEILRRLTGSDKFTEKKVRGLNRVLEIKTESKIRIALTDSLYQAKRFIERIKKQKLNNYQIIHVMACPEGCVGGAGVLAFRKTKNISGNNYGVEKRERLNW